MPYKDPEVRRAYNKVYGASYRAEHLEKERSRTKAYYKAHSEERKSYGRAWYQLNKEHHHYLVKAWVQAHKGEKASLTHAWYLANKQRKQAQSHLLYLKNPERKLKQGQVWRKANPEKTIEIKQRRRAREKNSKIGPIDIAAIKLRDRMMCCICAKKVAEREFSLDHSIPLALGGAHSEQNLRVAHRLCNIRRNTGRLPVQLVLI